VLGLKSPRPRSVTARARCARVGARAVGDAATVGSSELAAVLQHQDRRAEGLAVVLNAALVEPMAVRQVPRWSSTTAWPTQQF